MAAPSIPKRLARRPRFGGYVVPYFVQWLRFGELADETDNDARPDFRVINRARFIRCLRWRRCWLCGEPLGARATFVAGPMCTINRISAEPPSHHDCAEYAARVCPHLANPRHERRDGHYAREKIAAAGHMLLHNPGAVVLWTTARWQAFDAQTGQDGILIEMGEPTAVSWWAEGRRATRHEVDQALMRGMPKLLELAEADGAVRAIHGQVLRLEPWLPKETA